jgi:hypothetical protein
MQNKILKMGAAAIAAASLSACGDHGSSSTSTTTAPTTQELDSAAVLSMAQKTSETSEPIALDNNAVILTDTSDTTQPISVNGG